MWHSSYKERNVQEEIKRNFPDFVHYIGLHLRCSWKQNRKAVNEIQKVEKMTLSMLYTTKKSEKYISLKNSTALCYKYASVFYQFWLVAKVIMKSRGAKIEGKSQKELVLVNWK